MRGWPAVNKPYFQARYPDDLLVGQISELKHWIAYAETTREEKMIWVRELDLMHEYLKREEEVVF